VVTRLPGAETKRIWPALKNLAKDRNLIVHGFWAVDDAHDDRPVVLSHHFLVAAGISLAIIAVVNGLGTNLNDKFTSINSSLK
jgi:pilus assembly protein Flp/PilA